MAINYVGYIRRRMESLGTSLRDHTLTYGDDSASPETVAWMRETADRILEMCDQIEPEEWRYRYLEPTAPPH